MTLRSVLRNLAKVVSDEADRNPQFAERLWTAINSASSRVPAKGSTAVTGGASKAKRGANRRPPAVIDPIAVASEGEVALRAKLAQLSLEELKDIVAEYGMDRERLVMKWKTASRVIDRIVEISIGRARKGSAFRS